MPLTNGENLLERGQRKPQEENKLERIVEREPVHNTDKALNNAVKNSLDLLFPDSNMTV